jgi:hypothetical protein
MATINYLLAACSHRAYRLDTYLQKEKKYLKQHLNALLKIDLSLLSQLTIIRALPLQRNAESSEYWDIDKILKRFSCPIEILDVQDAYFSYSSWIKAIEKYKKLFDYYILMEDDYYLSHLNGIKILQELHCKKLPYGGYLNGFTIKHPVLSIPAVSNGICDNKIILEELSKINDPFLYLKKGAQSHFGMYFQNKLEDYTEEYRTLFWNNRFVVQTRDYSIKNKEDLINPIQYLFKGFKE